MRPQPKEINKWIQTLNLGKQTLLLCIHSNSPSVFHCPWRGGSGRRPRPLSPLLGLNNTNTRDKLPCFPTWSHFSVIRQQLASWKRVSHLEKRCLAFNYTHRGNRVTVRDDQWDTVVTTNGVFIRSIRMKTVAEVESLQYVTAQTHTRGKNRE